MDPFLGLSSRHQDQVFPHWEVKVSLTGRESFPPWVRKISIPCVQVTTLALILSYCAIVDPLLGLSSRHQDHLDHHVFQCQKINEEKFSWLECSMNHPQSPN